MHAPGNHALNPLRCIFTQVLCTQFCPWSSLLFTVFCSVEKLPSIIAVSAARIVFVFVKSTMHLNYSLLELEYFVLHHKCRKQMRVCPFCYLEH